MHRYLVRRILFGLLTAVLVSLLVFALMRIAPGDVAQSIAAQQGSGEEGTVSEEDLEKIREALGLNEPLYVQYWVWMRGFVVGDWGDSLFTKRPVFDDFKQKASVTLELVVLSQIIAIALGLPAGVLMALKQDSKIDYMVRIVSLAGLSIPSFWSATLLLVAGAYFFRWSPPLGYSAITDDFTRNLNQFIWPALMIGYISAATKARMMRSTMLEVLRQDYIRTAHAKGLRAYAVTARHALKNALIPVITVIGITTALSMGGSVVMEQVFTLPGIGEYIVAGMLERDYPIVQSMVMFFAICVIVVNLLVDLSYGWLDPRVRYQ
jgi:peptide/nickel transport system permease protein